jgi:hypothetical protein
MFGRDCWLQCRGYLATYYSYLNEPHGVLHALQSGKHAGPRLFGKLTRIQEEPCLVPKLEFVSNPHHARDEKICVTRSTVAR